MKKKNKAGLSGLLAVLLLVIAVTGVWWTGHMSAVLTGKTANQISSLYLRELSSATGKHLQTALEYHFTQIDAVAKMLTEETASDEAGFSRFIRTMKETQGFSFLAFVDEDGYYYDGRDVFSAASNVSFLGRLLKGETHLISYNEKIQNDDVILMGTAIDPVSAKDTRYIAVLAGLKTETMRKKMVLANDQSQTYSSVVTSNGTYVILSKMKDQFKGSNMLSILKKYATFSSEGDWDDVVRGLQTGGEGAYFITMNTGEPFYLYYTPLENTEWYLVTLMPYEVIEGTIRELGESINYNSMTLFSGFLVVLVILFALYIWFSRKKQAQLRQTKAAAEQAFQIAEDANRAKSVFLSNMSHDIRTPMNAIVGFVTLLDRDADSPEKVHEYAKKIAHSGRHLLGLINDVLDMAKIESGKTTLNVSKTNLSELIDDINTIIRPQMKAKGHQFDIQIHNVRHEVLNVDKLRIHQILLNLLSNAVKYTPDGGHIVLKVTELPYTSGQYAKYSFRVEDNGYGMEKDYLESVFDVFSREQNSVVNKIQGTGLGLAITKNLVNLMGGKISVESEKGKGSVFTVTLKLMIAEETDVREFWKNSRITRMLVVDDEESVGSNVSWIMEKLGVTVDCALEGATALELVKAAEQEEDPYQTILLDWKMPGKDGIETAREIRQLVPANIPIMILTSYDYSEIEDEMLKGVVDGFITKPFFESSFRRKIQEVLKDDTETIKPDEKCRSSLRDKNILIAEDNELNAEIITELLRMKGADCVVCENGQVAYETFEKSEKDQFQLILMDVQMPVMNGYQAARLIRGSTHPQAETIPIIALTANAFSEDIQNTMDAGMNAHMAKPVDMDVLEKIVCDLTCRKAQQQ